MTTEAPEQLSGRVLMEELRLERRRRNLSQRFIAERMGVATPAVSRWERGARGMQLDTFLRYGVAVTGSTTVLMRVIRRVARQGPSLRQLPLPVEDGD